jgi:hypothetical protein
VERVLGKFTWAMPQCSSTLPTKDDLQNGQDESECAEDDGEDFVFVGSWKSFLGEAVVGCGGVGGGCCDGGGVDHGVTKRRIWCLLHFVVLEK